jgi:hypothetical protein
MHSPSPLVKLESSGLLASNPRDANLAHMEYHDMSSDMLERDESSPISRDELYGAMPFYDKQQALLFHKPQRSEIHVMYSGQGHIPSPMLDKPRSGSSSVISFKSESENAIILPKNLKQ